MAVLSNVLGFAAFGVGTRMFQLGLQKRPLTAGPAAYAAAAAAFGAFGYWVDGVEIRQLQMIHEKEDMLRERRQNVGHGPLPAIASHSSKS
ncbi:hypothetical protein FRB95_007604 [Tulasnella sp. JGI-2019a]|nr:hypothetical protein FRB93_007804 [Tulasnella sp. JGI-2019a]KAG9027573.1 hypothetical protein FRB95_007604 [Tulasnella sp. JGI-2019a]